MLKKVLISASQLLDVTYSRLINPSSQGKWGLFKAVLILLLITSCRPKPPAATPLPPSPPPPEPTASPEPSPTPIQSVTLVKSSQSFETTFTYQIGLGDVDLDGDLDAVFSNMRDNDSQVWINDGSGHFTDSGQRLTNQSHGVSLGDLDGDGDLDLFITRASSGSGDTLKANPSKIYFNNGAGIFQDSGQDLGDTELNGNAVQLIDIDADGDLDAHVEYIPDPDRIYLNDGRGYFGIGGIPVPEEATWGDLNSDGFVDLFVKELDLGYKTMLNDGAGNFNDHWRMADPNVKLGDVSLNDFDGDGDLDALIANGLRSGDHPTILMLNDGAGNFTDSGQRLSTTNGASLGVGDLNGDGHLDVYISNLQRPNEIWVNTGTGHLLDTGIRMGGYTQTTEVSLGDLDNDGDLDIFLGSFSGGSEVWFNQ